MERVTTIFLVKLSFACLASSIFAFAAQGQEQTSTLNYNISDINSSNNIGLVDKDKDYSQIGAAAPKSYLPRLGMRVRRTGNELESVQQADTLLYYELMDNWVNLDFGFNLKSIDGQSRARSSNVAGAESLYIDARIPTLYGRVFFDLPGEGFSVGGSSSVIQYHASEISDMELGLSYKSTSGFGAATGWRNQKIKLNAQDDTLPNLQGDALYLDTFFHF